jgi:hypothetical protein
MELTTITCEGECEELVSSATSEYCPTCGWEMCPECFASESHECPSEDHEDAVYG